MLHKNFVLYCFLILLIPMTFGCQNPEIVNEKSETEQTEYFFPHEGSKHEGTWLQ